MAPEYGATIGFFPVDDETLAYLRFTGRPDDAGRRWSRRTARSRACSTPRTRPSRCSRDTLELDLATVVPSLAGPKRPQDRVPLKDMKQRFREVAGGDADRGPTGRGREAGGKAQAPRGTGASERLAQTATVNQGTLSYRLGHGAVVIAAITSCTNTSNPAVLLARGAAGEEGGGARADGRSRG